MKRALITGAAGFIGRHFSRYLYDQGWDVCPLDIRYANSSIEMDVRDFFKANDFRYDLVVHCAAHVGGRLDIEGRAAFIGAYNVQLDGAMFEWALRTKPAHIVYWSSSAAYPVEFQTDDLKVRLQEHDICVTQPDEADFTYGWAKLVGERLAIEAQTAGLKVHVFRPFSGYAADQDTSYPFGAFVARARRRAHPFTIWGSGEQTRDFIHIDDIIAATMAVIEAEYPSPLNLCTGRATSFNTLAKLVTEAVGYSFTFEHDLSKPEGVRYRVGDPAELHKIYVPRVSLEEGIKAALQD